jgi:hypothetical protein
LSVDAAAVDDPAAAVAVAELVTSAASAAAVEDAGAPTTSTPSSSAAAVGAYSLAGAVVVVADVSTSLGPTEAAAGTAVWKPSSMNPNVRGFVTVAIVLAPSVEKAFVGGGMKKAPVTDTGVGVEAVGLGTGSSWPS